MSAELKQRDLRISNADRERAVAHLEDCTGEGRLNLDEFAERVDAVYAAKTFADLDPILADLPAAGGVRRSTVDALVPPPASSAVEIRAAASSVRREGRWIVPRRLRVSGKAGSVRLDLSQAVIQTSEVDIDVSLVAGSLKVILPRHATADDHDLRLWASSSRNRAQAADTAGGTVHVRLHGELKASSVKVRRKWRFLGWEF